MLQSRHVGIHDVRDRNPGKSYAEVSEFSRNTTDYADSTDQNRQLKPRMNTNSHESGR